MGKGCGNLREMGRRLTRSFESELNDQVLHFVKGRKTIKHSKTKIKDFEKLIKSAKGETMTNQKQAEDDIEVLRELIKRLEDLIVTIKGRLKK